MLSWSKVVIGCRAIKGLSEKNASVCSETSLSLGIFTSRAEEVCLSADPHAALFE